MDIKKERTEAFKLGYVQAIDDITKFMENIPKRAGGNALFQRDAYADEVNQFAHDAIIRAELRAEQRINEVMYAELEEKKSK